MIGNRAISPIHKLNQNVFCLFSFSLSFDPHWNSKALIALVIISLFNVEFSWDALKKVTYFKLLVMLAIYITLNMLFVGDGIYLDQYNLLGSSALIYFILFQTKSMNVKHILNSFVLGVFTVGLINVTIMLWRLSSNDLAIYNSWDDFSIFDIHKIYYAVYLSMSYAIILYYLYYGELKIYVYFVCLPFTVLLLFITGSVSGLLTFIIINILFVIIKFFSAYFKVFSGIILTLPVCLLFLLSLNVAQEVFGNLDGDESRIRNYNVNKEIFFNALIFGHGIGLELKTMQTARNEKSWEYKEKYNAHNQYFEILIGGGLFYLILQFSLAVSVLYIALKKDSEYKWLVTTFCVIIFYTFLIESFLNRHHGFMFFAFILTLLWYLEEEESIKIKHTL